MSSWALLGRPLARRWRSLLRLAGWSSIEALPALTSGVLVARATDDGFLAGRAWVGVGWLAGFGLLQVMRTAATARMLPELADVVEPVRDALVETVVAGTLRRVVHGDRRPDASAVTRLTEQIRSIRGVLGGLLLQLRSVVAATLAAAAGLALLAPELTVAALVPVLACVAVFVRLQRGLRSRQRAVLIADEHLARSTGAALDGIRDVVACGALERVAAELDAAVQARAVAERRLVLPESGRLLVLAAADALPLLAALAVTPWLLHAHRLSAGQVLGAATYLVTSLQPALALLLGGVARLGLQLSVTLERVAESAAPSATAHRCGAWPRHVELVVRGLTFGYGPTPVIEDLDLELADGGHLAVIGPSGAGKSTLTGLLTGLLEPRRGTLTIGGYALADLDQRWLRRQLALLPQEAYVFAGTVRENLCYLAPDSDDTTVVRAVDALGLGPLVTRLGGLSGTVGGLSEGERQLIALTRVYLSPATLVILDEGSCHLDPAAELRVERAFRERGGTLIVVAHRISSALRADQILLLDGRMSLSGTDTELRAASPAYRELAGHWTTSPGP